MASIRKEIVIEASPKRVWDAVRDVGAVHERLAPGFVVDTGRGRLAAIDPPQRVDAGLRRRRSGSRVVWIADLLPSEIAGTIAAMIEEGLGAMKKTLER